jgi:hypothetical protein
VAFVMRDGFVFKEGGAEAARIAAAAAPVDIDDAF